MKRLIIVLAILIVGLGIAEKLSQNVKIKSPSFSLPRISLFQKLPTPTPTKTPQVFVKGSDEERLVSIIEKSLPSVVTIGINFTAQERGSIEFDPFNPFGFRQIPGRKREVEQNIGSGFIVDASGLIITNKHVVEETNAKYKVLLNSEETYPVEKIYRDPLNDLAILKISPKEKLPALTLGDSTNLKLGQTTIAIGTPLGEFTNSVTKGIVSGLGRGIDAGSPFEGFVERLDDVIQTDAAISPGNSGGPLLNSQGKVIGVNTAVSSQGENIGFAIPSALVKTILQEFEDRGGSFERAYIGIQYKMLDRKTAIANDLVEGAYVLAVQPDSPAEKAGIKEDDVITKIDGERVTGSDEQSIAKILVKKNVGQTVNITLYREGEEMTIRVTLVASP